MPTYEYECPHCGYSFEAFQKISDLALDRCPQCQKKVKRLIGSGSAIIFKGSGFYATDYRKKSTLAKEGESKTCPNTQTKEECRSCLVR